MDHHAAIALLPAGLMDVLPPSAAFEAQTVQQLMAHFAAFGFERVKPPLIEFAETMLAGSAAALEPDTFRLMDPQSQRLLALRPDMTMQVARIAASRLAHWPRPLRLSYAGQVLRVRGSQLRPARQFGQVGAEIIGSASTAADAELIVLATSALADVGLTGLSVDLGLPTLVPAILATLSPNAADLPDLRLALDRKDVAGIDALASVIGAPTATVLGRLVASVGPADRAVAALEAVDLPDAACAERASLVAVIDRLRRATPTLPLTVDTVESRGFEYHTGVTYTLFAGAALEEIGRGGHYRTPSGEAAAGITLFMDNVLPTLPRPKRAHRLLLPADTPVAAAWALRSQGWIALSALEDGVDLHAEAHRLGCEHVFVDGTVVPARSPAASGKE